MFRLRSEKKTGRLNLKKTDRFVVLTGVVLCWAGFTQDAKATSSEHPKPWNEPARISPETTFFGEKIREKRKDKIGSPARSDKAYPWFYLEKGQRYSTEKRFEQAVASFREAFTVPGPTRVLAGFHLIEALRAAGRPNEALDVLEEMERHYLVSSSDRSKAVKIRMDLSDDARKLAVQEKAPTLFTGREWLGKLQQWRMQFVLDGMQELRRHGIPLKEPAHKYVFLLDEHFLKNPTLPADDPAETLASLIDQYDEDARLPIHRWRMSPENTLTDEAKAWDEEPNQLTGAQWLTLVHNDKMAYIEQAMQVLESQHVPMEKTIYGYVDALDKLFTSHPELPAQDGAVALGSYLYQSEPRAKAVLEALRLE